MSLLFKYWKIYWKQIALCICFLILESICDLLQPTIVSKIIDNGVKTLALGYVIKMSLLMLLNTSIGAIGAVMRNIISSRVSQRFAAVLRLDLFTKINALSFEELGKYDSSTFITRLTNDTSQLQNFTHGMMRIFIRAPILCIGSLVMVTLLNPRLALILLVAVPLVCLLIYASLKLGYPFFYRMQKALDKNNSVSREYLSGVRVVKAFNSFDIETERYKEANYQLADISIKAHRIMSVFTPIITFCVNMSIIVLLWLSPSMMPNSNLKVGQIMAFVNYMTQILFSLNMIFNVYQQFIRAKASADRVGEILSIDTSDDNDEKKKTPVPTLTGSIEFSNIYFSYPNGSGQPVLNNASFVVNPGETAGIIGSTGSGKTSLIQLIPGFYKPTSGTIYIDGVDIEEYDTNDLRTKIALVSQKVQLFTGTIADNIRWGNMSATDEQVVAAAKAAQAHGFITSFPDGYSTILGQNGVNLSGGQKQRISIARALIRKPDILILDDCVSSVDVATEAAILKEINALSGSITCVMITQRISSVMKLPKIIVMDDGETVGVGTHEQLINSCPTYREIYRSQLGKEATA